jgi:hypothetical protein
MTEIIVRAIVTFLTGKALRPPALPRDDDLGRWFFYNSLPFSLPHPQLETCFRLRQPIIGIGAPGIFLKDVAEALHTDLIFARIPRGNNAVGAIAGSVMVTEDFGLPSPISTGLEVLSTMCRRHCRHG